MKIKEIENFQTFLLIELKTHAVTEMTRGQHIALPTTVAPWAYKDKKLVSLKISTNPS